MDCGGLSGLLSLKKDGLNFSKEHGEGERRESPAGRVALGVSLALLEVSMLRRVGG